MNAGTAGTADMLEAFDNGTRGFRATQVDGPDIDLVQLAGLSFLEELIDELVPESTWEWILVECGSATVIEEEEFEGGPGQSDTFFRIEVDDLEGLRSELSAVYLERLDQALRSESANCRGMKANRPRINIGVAWAHDVHDCTMALDTFRRVLKGQPIVRKRRYGYEGRQYLSTWYFNPTRPWELHVTILGGADGFIGQLSSAMIRMVRG